MRKTFLLALVGFIIIAIVSSCKGDPKSDKQELKEAVKDTTAVVAVEEEKPEKEPVKSKPKKKKSKPKPKKTQEIKLPKGMTSITDEAAKKYIRDYERYVVNYKKAVDANDMDSFLKLNDASSSLSRQYNSLMSTLSGEDIEKISKYMQEKTVQLNKLSEKMYQ